MLSWPQDVKAEVILTHEGTCINLMIFNLKLAILKLTFQENYFFLFLNSKSNPNTLQYFYYLYLYFKRKSYFCKKKKKKSEHFNPKWVLFRLKKYKGLIFQSGMISSFSIGYPFNLFYFIFFMKKVEKHFCKLIC